MRRSDETRIADSRRFLELLKERNDYITLKIKSFANRYTSAAHKGEKEGKGTIVGRWGVQVNARDASAV